MWFWLMWKMRNNCTNALHKRDRHFSLIEQNTSAIEISHTSHNYCDNERISAIFEALKCASSALQFWLDRWKSYVIFDWSARCATIARTLAFKMCFDDWFKRIWRIFSFERRFISVFSIDEKSFDNSFIDQKVSRSIIRN